MDFKTFNADLDESIDILEASGSLEKIGFTKEQAHFINLLISRAIEKYHNSSVSKTD